MSKAIYIQRHRQQGVVLVVALIFLLVLSLLGVSAMNTTMLETRMARNDQERNYALQAAELGLRNTLARITVESAEDLVQTGGLGSNTPETIETGRGSTDLDAEIRNWQITFFGRFPVPRLPANLASSSIQFQAVLFDTQVMAASNRTETPTIAQLQNGIRQLVPRQN